MKKFLKDVSHLSPLFWIKSALVALLLCVCLLVYINSIPITFAFNGFKNLTQPLQVYFLDVGQASSTLVLLPNGQTMLIDAGTEESSTQLVQSLDWIFRQHHLDSIDMLVLTHPDADHVGGVSEVVKHFEVKNAFRPKVWATCERNRQIEYDFSFVYTNEYNSAILALNGIENCQVDFVEDLHIQSQANFCIDFYACQDDKSSETNYYSPFIVLEYANKSFMFTGDATAQREEEFLQMLKEEERTIEIDFLCVAHHGSKYSSTQNFLNEICPSYAFVSAGDEVHPTQQVIKRLHEVGVEDIYVTKEIGTIAVAVDEFGNFQILACTLFVDTPLLVVTLSILCFLALFWMEAKSKNPKAVFSLKNNNNAKKFV